MSPSPPTCAHSSDVDFGWGDLAARRIGPGRPQEFAAYGANKGYMTLRAGNRRLFAHRRWVLAALCLALLAPSTSVLAGTPGSYTFDGRVTDVLGRGVPGVAVQMNDGEDVFTGADGRYEVTYIGSAGSFRLSTLYVVEPQSRQVTAVTPGRYTTDFADSRYLLYADRLIDYGRHDISTISELPGEFPLSFSTTAPAERLCATATDSRTGDSVPMTVAAPYNSGSRWDGKLSIPSGGQAGYFDVTFYGVDCVTGQRLTWDGWQPGSQAYHRSPYRVDLAPPEVSITLPLTAHTYVQHKDTGPSADGKTRVVGTLSVGYHATDDAGLSSAKITVTSASGSTAEKTQSLSGQDADAGCYFFGIGCFAVSPGTHTISIVVTDTAGRVSAPATQTFVAVAG